MTNTFHDNNSLLTNTQIRELHIFLTHVFYFLYDTK